jgi:hypothetical protein
MQYYKIIFSDGNTSRFCSASKILISAMQEMHKEFGNEMLEVTKDEYANIVQPLRSK